MKKNLIIIIAGVVVLIVILFLVFGRGGAQPEQMLQDEFPIQDEMIIDPEIDFIPTPGEIPGLDLPVQLP